MTVDHTGPTREPDKPSPSQEISFEGTKAKAPSPFRVALASFAGTAVEYYDFAIYGLAAALVFPRVFFPEATAFAGALASFATFAVGFIARPLGAIVLGHFGDKVGRRSILVFSLVLMGGATTAIGVLPSYATIGMLAPALLTLMRLLQGFAYGGEFGGAVLMAYEHAPATRKGFYASLPQTGPPAGTLLGNLAFLAVAFLPQEQLLSWGWRVPFLASAILVVLGVVIRSRIAESPEFATLKQRDEHVKIPLVEALRSQWRQVLLVAGSFAGFGVATITHVVFSVGYMRQTGASNLVVLSALCVALMLMLATVPLSGALADRVGRTRLFVGGALASGASLYLFFPLLRTGTFLGILCAYLITMTILHALGYAALPALFSEAFTANVRYTGMSLGFQLAGLVTSFAPTVALLLTRDGDTTVFSTALFGLLVLSAICIVALERVTARLRVPIHA